MRCQPLTFATRTRLSSTRPTGVCPDFSVTGLVDLLGGWVRNSWSGANVLSCIQGCSTVQSLVPFLRLGTVLEGPVLAGKCRADQGSSTGFFSLGYRTWSAVRRDSGKVGYPEFKS